MTSFKVVKTKHNCNTIKMSNPPPNSNVENAQDPEDPASPSWNEEFLNSEFERMRLANQNLRIRMAEIRERVEGFRRRSMGLQNRVEESHCRSIELQNRVLEVRSFRSIRGNCF